MVRAIVWKEFREQGLIALTLLVLGSGVLVAAATLADPPAASSSPTDLIRFLGAGRLATLMLAVTAGMVCGGALFAAEREAGTMGFLDSLPASRWKIWRAKLAAGFALAAIQIVVVVGVAAGLGQVPSVGWAAAVAAYSLLAFSWGAYGSSVARTTLGSVGVAISAATVASFVFLLPIMIFLQNPGTSLPRPDGFIIFLGLMLVTPIAGSALVFTRPDRERTAHEPVPRGYPIPVPGGEARPVPESPPPTASRLRPRLGLQALAWLAARQLLLPGAVSSGFALVFGLVLLLPGAYSFLVWPVLGLTAGVLAGVTAFADEQSRGMARFWGERRLPVGRVWAVKVAAHALFALGLVGLLVLPSVIRAEAIGLNRSTGQTFLAVVFRSLMFDQLNGQGWKYLFVPVVYGFAAGHLAGLLFRKVVVAAGVAGLVGGTAAALWLPSLLAGGLTHWQVWLPPAVTLATARVLIRPWAAERLTARGPLGTLAVGLAVVVLIEAAGLGYRAIEAPDPPGGQADLDYIAALPPFDDNLAGRDFRSAAEQFLRAAGHATSKHDPRLSPQGPRPMRAEDRVELAVIRGWPGDDPDLAAWLDEVYEFDSPLPDGSRPWHVQAAAATQVAERTEAAGRSIGAFADPRLVSPTAKDAALENSRRMALVLVARGLQKQTAGDPLVMVHNLRIVLALGRSLRDQSTVVSLLTGQAVGHIALFGADRWLEARDGRPDLLREAIGVLRGDDEAAPFDPTPHFLAERYILREALKSPGQWLPVQITLPGQDRDAVAAEADLVAFAWTVPWERERTRRLVGLGFESRAPAASGRLVRGRPGATTFLLARSPAGEELAEFDRQLRVRRRVAILRLAVRLYQAEKGTVPPALADLVAAGLLPAVPLDPYDNRPLRYRVSLGETLAPPPPPQLDRLLANPPRDEPLKVPAGQAILWSVGPNRTDEGGLQAPPGAGRPTRADDLVFLVPVPPGGGKDR